MAKTKPAWMDGLDQDQINFYLSLEPAVAVCRGKRRHKFPGLVPGKDVPDTVDIRRVNGIYQVTEFCERECGRSITYTAGREGIPDYSTAKYGGWKDGKELATGLGLTAGDDALHMRYIQKQAVLDGFALRERQRQTGQFREAVVSGEKQ